MILSKFLASDYPRFLRLNQLTLNMVIASNDANLFNQAWKDAKHLKRFKTKMIW